MVLLYRIVCQCTACSSQCPCDFGFVCSVGSERIQRYEDLLIERLRNKSICLGEYHKIPNWKHLYTEVITNEVV